MNNMNKNGSRMRLFLNRMLVYLAVMIFMLWICSVIESFIPYNSRWVIVTVQAFFVIKVTFIVGMLLLPLVFISRDPFFFKIGFVVVLTLLIGILLKSDIASCFIYNGKVKTREHVRSRNISIAVDKKFKSIGQGQVTSDTINEDTLGALFYKGMQSTLRENPLIRITDSNNEADICIRGAYYIRNNIIIIRLIIKCDCEPRTIVLEGSGADIISALNTLIPQVFEKIETFKPRVSF